jgi:hypothetical protein
LWFEVGLKMIAVVTLITSILVFNAAAFIRILSTFGIV